MTRLLRTVLGNRGIARLEAGWACMSLGQWTFSIALALYAYYEEGAGGVALAVAARMLPAALLGPLADRLSASLGPRTVLGGAALVRFALLELVALVVWKELPFPLLLTLAAGFELAGSVQRPARTTMLIGIARSPGELAAASAGRFTDYVGFLAGGLLAGLLVAGSGLDVAFAVAGAAYLAGAAMFFTLPPKQRVPAGPRRAQGRVAARDPWLRMRVALFGASTLVQSMLELLLVVTALDVLAMGPDGVGWLRAAFAFGGIAGAAAALALLRRGRLALGLATGLALAGVPLALVPAWPRAAPGLVLLALLGGGYALLEAALLFLTQRLAQPATLARLAALEELVYPLARAAGAGIAALLVVQLGDAAALVVAGALLPLAALVSLRALQSAEQRAAVPEREFRLLREVPCFAPLPTATVENLAACAEHERFDAGRAIAGGFHVIEDGAVEVRANGGPPERLGAGDSFGLDSLLRDTAPPDASALTAVAAVSIARSDFVSRVTPPARAAVRAARARRSP